ncbi:DUF4979 domain-containing protein [Hymenobacter jejuensis]|nr:DUF4979 domain-containing protein [Hymenobacter jejuensis]
MLSAFFCLGGLTLLHTSALAQQGALNDDFSTGSNSGWITPVTGSSSQVTNGQLVVNMAVQDASRGYYRGDFQKSGGVTFHAGTHPIVAVKFNKPPRANFFFDTNLGSYNGTNNNATKIETATGNVYYWDLSTGKLGSTTLSRTQPTTVSLFQFKLAEIVLTQAEIAAKDFSFEVSWVKTFSSVDELRAYATPVGTPHPVFEYTGQFVHPGLLHNAADLARIKSLVDTKFGRAYKSYQLLAASSKASSSYAKAGPFKLLTRDATLTIATPTGTASGGAVKNGVESDFMAAYYNALMWNITGNEAHAQKAVEIIDAYADFTVGIAGTDAELNGLYGFMLANAAELMRSTYPAWGADRVQKCQAMLKNVFYPTLQNFKPCAHGNWDIICMKALMAIAIFSEDTPMFNKVVNYFYYGEGNGSIDRYVLTPAGQLQESNRDQPHTMLAIGSLAEIAEIALKQGTDLYSASNNAIMRGYEYTAKYNLGYDVPYQTSYDYCEKNYTDYTPEAISAVERGVFRAVFEIAYNHYVFRKNQKMPYTLEVLGRTGPEGAPFGADNPGYGSLFFYLNPKEDYEYTGGAVDPAVGLLNDNFTTGTDGWQAATAGSTATAADGQLKITIVTPVGGKGRGDMKKPNTTLYPNNYPILAIKMKKPAAVNLTLDTNLGAYGNGANKWTGKVGEDIYYYDMTKVGFGAGPMFITTPTSLGTFQFKVADITSGESSYTVDWVKTVKSVNDLLAYDPNTGLINDNFTAGTDGWAPATSGSTAIAENGQLKVSLATLAGGKGRGDIKRTAGATLYPANYPILAIKLKNPAVVNLTLDTNLGSFGNGGNRYTGKVGEHIYYFDLSKTGFGPDGTLLSAPTALALFQLKVADITSGEAGYLVDWVKTVKTVEELQGFVAPDYQDVVFPVLAEKKVGDADFTPATSSAGLAITYRSSNPEVATVVDGRVHLVGAGSAEITASQPGNNAYYPAEAITRTLTVAKGNQEITFAPVGNQVYGSGPIEVPVVATSSSGLPVTVTVSSGPAQLSGSLLTVTGIGTIILQASQAGSANYLAAANVEQSFEVQDLTKPTVQTKNITLQLNEFGSAVLAPAQVNEGSSDNYTAAANLKLVLDQTTFGCDQVGPNKVTLTVTDESGNSASGTAVVTVLGEKPSPSIVATPSSVYVNGVPTLYIGYGPQSATLTASGGSSYAWSPATGLSDATSAAPVFTPTAAGTYIFTVTATSSTGCKATTTLTLTVEDVRCGAGSDKVQVCHKGQVICVAAGALNAHLGHGDQLGSCAPTASRNPGQELKAPALATTAPIFEAYPNPFAESTTVHFRATQTTQAKLQVYNALGQLVATLYEGQAQADQDYHVSLSGQALANGLYTCRLSLGGKLYTQRLALTK